MKNNLKIKRLEKNMTQEDLARKCEITLRHIQNIEYNKSIPKVDIAIKIQRALDIERIEELFEIDE